MSYNRLPIADSNLILTGYTGPNQPSISRAVARELAMPLVNVEARIAEQTGLSMDQIRQQFGQARLKTVEAQVMGEVLLNRNAVIRINGRTLLNGDNLSRLQATGPVICLIASLDAVLQRLHLSLGARYNDPGQRAIELGRLRAHWAARGAPGIYEIDTTYQTEAETIAAVIDLWQQVAVTRT